jgi:uncharacterized UPF0160 family protein
MKLIILVDGSTKNFLKLVDLLDNPDDCVLINTEKCEPKTEYKVIAEEIKKLSSVPLLIVKFSGREEVFYELGSEFSEMIVFLSYKKKSPHYVENVPQTFMNIINLFSKET